MENKKRKYVKREKPSDVEPIDKKAFDGFLKLATITKPPQK